MNQNQITPADARRLGRLAADKFSADDCCGLEGRDALLAACVADNLAAEHAAGSREYVEAFRETIIVMAQGARPDSEIWLAEAAERASNEWDAGEGQAEGGYASDEEEAEARDDFIAAHPDAFLVGVNDFLSETYNA
ncbi:NAD-dependent epimerase/dehydratase [Burkholderiales bacterium GJ-E10]|nr:NAD-dependent epimerase/dehydratase [Burkholderiales bacterium GJ-E10]